MNKYLVVFESYTGFTRKYAQWLGEELECEVLPLKSLSPEKLNNCGRVIFGGPLIVGKLGGLQKIKGLLEGKQTKVTVFATGATPKEETETVEEAITKLFTKEEREEYTPFYLEGGLDYEHMKFIHKTMMKMMSSMLKKKKDDSEEGRARYERVAKSQDFTKRENIQPLVEYLKKVEISS